jgi:signal transduction histidine kinase
LRPPELDHLGLQAALARYVEQWSRRSGVTLDFVCTGFSGGRLPPEMEVTLYRVLQEALTNVLKHARAKSVSLVIEKSPAEVLVVVEDDGCGFDVEAPGGDGLGLLGMRERVELAGGTLKIESASDAGTTLVVRISLNPTHVRAAN